MFAGLLPPTMFCREMFCPPSWFYPPCPPPLRVGGNRKSRGNILAARLRELILRFLRACFWAFIFRAPGRWTELWSRLGQARCVGVMAALPRHPTQPYSITPLPAFCMANFTLFQQPPHNPAMNCLDVLCSKELWCICVTPLPAVHHAEANILIP